MHLYVNINASIFLVCTFANTMFAVNIFLNIMSFVFIDRKLVCCETAHRDFLEILATVGGENEKKRADEMLKNVTVVPDDPSEQALLLEKTSKIKERSKVTSRTISHFLCRIISCATTHTHTYIAISSFFVV